MGRRSLAAYKRSDILQRGFQSVFPRRKANFVVQKVSFLVYFILLQPGSAFYPAAELRAALATAELSGLLPLAIPSKLLVPLQTQSPTAALAPGSAEAPLQVKKSRTGFHRSGWKNSLKPELHITWIPCFPPSGCKGDWSQALSRLSTQHFLGVVLRVVTNTPPHRHPEWEQDERWLLHFLLFQLLQISRKHHTGSQGKGCPDTTWYVDTTMWSST